RPGISRSLRCPPSTSPCLFRFFILLCSAHSARHSFATRRSTDLPAGRGRGRYSDPGEPAKHDSVFRRHLRMRRSGANFPELYWNRATTRVGVQSPDTIVCPCQQEMITEAAVDRPLVVPAVQLASF